MDKRKLRLIIKILVASFFIWWLFKKNDLTDVVFYLKQMDIWWMFAFLLIYILGIAMSAYKWQFIAKFKKFDLDFREAFKIYFTGTFINNFFPSVIGGDAYRSYKLGRSNGNKYLEAAATVFFDRLTGLLAVMLLIVIFSLPNLSFVFQNKVLYVLNAFMIFCIVSFLSFAIMLKTNLMKNILKKISIKIVRIVEEFSSFNKSPIMLKSLGWGMLYNFLGVGVAAWLLFADLHVSINFWDFIVAISAISIISSIPVSIGNIGIKEWSFMVFFGIYGVNGEAALSVAIFMRFLQMLVSFFAIPIYLNEKNVLKEVRQGQST